MIERVTRSLTLLRVFVVLSALVLGIGGLALGSLVASAIRGQAVDDRESALTQYVDGVLGRELVHGNRLRVDRDPSQDALRRVHSRDDILSVKVWRPNGVLAWTDTDPKRIGHRYDVEQHLADALEGNGEAELENLKDEGEHAGEREAGIKRALEVYAPVRSDDGRQIVGAFEVYADARPLEEAISSRRNEIWLVIALVFIGLCGALGLLARKASNTLRRQTRLLQEHSAALAESYDALERSTLDAIESLNATVEAKDPYTAGHSTRVRRVALALGNELGLSKDELDALRLGGLFHDIGKIAIPDAILLKPARLTADEFERMKEHSAALAESYDALERSTLDAIESLNATVEAKDPYTAGHSARVRRLALALGNELALSSDELDALRLGGLFHDIGKIAIPDAILLKPGRLTEDEFERMKDHSAEGARIVGKLSQLGPIVPIIRHHHERWDGRGYPDGLAGQDIPLLAAIVGLADAWDAMTTERPYAAAMEPEEALEEIRRGNGTQFAPAVAQAMLRIAERDPAELGLEPQHAAV